MTDPVLISQFGSSGVVVLKDSDNVYEAVLTKLKVLGPNYLGEFWLQFGDPIDNTNLSNSQ